MDGIRMLKLFVSCLAPLALALPAAGAAGRLNILLITADDMNCDSVGEEFYDIQNDPDALKNLIDDPKHQADIERFRKRLADWMRRTQDPALYAFENRASREARRQFMAEQDRKTRPGKAKRREKPRRAP